MPSLRLPRRYLLVAAAALLLMSAAPSSAKDEPVTHTPLVTVQNGTAGTMVTDAAGNLYLAGVGFPGLTVNGMRPNGYQTVPRNEMDAFVAKVAADGTALWVTLLAGDGYEVLRSLAVLRDGRVAYAGQTSSSDFPSAQATGRADNGPAEAGKGLDAVVGLLSADGTRLLFGDHIASGTVESAGGVAVAPDGSIVVAGHAQFDRAPNRHLEPTPGAHRTGHRSKVYGWAVSYAPDGRRRWLARVDPLATAAPAERAAGRKDDVWLHDLAVDARGIVLAGVTNSARLPGTAAGAQPRIGRPGSPGIHAEDAFVLRLSLDGRRMLDGTYLGGSHADEAQDIDVAPDGAVLVAGNSASADLPGLGGTRRCEANGDGMVAQLTPDLRRLRWARCLGGSETDSAGNVSVDGAGGAFIAGTTNSEDFDGVRAAQPYGGGSYDAFAAHLTADGTVRYATPLGGALDELGGGVVNAGGAALVAVGTLSPDRPTPGAGYRGFVGRLDEP